MEDTIPTQFWGLYATGEFKLVQQFCELGKALESLGSTATEQESSIPDCPACEIWFSAFCPVQKFVENFPESLPSNFEKGLQHIFALGNGLSEAALRCGDRSIFSNPEWEPIRAEANEVLAMMGWESLKTYINDLLQECRRAI